MRTFACCFAAALAAPLSAQVAAVAAEASFETLFDAPVRVQAAGEPIQTEIGHSAPYTCDWDGDGVRDLLVGQFGSGKLWIFRNEGTDKAPKYGKGVTFEADGRPAKVAAG